MVWHFFKNFTRMFRIKAGTKIFTRFFVLQGHDVLQNQLDQQKRKHKQLLKRYHTQLYIMQLFNYSHNYNGLRNISNINLENNDEYHSIHIHQNQDDLSDLRTVYSQYQNQDRNFDFQVLQLLILYKQYKHSSRYLNYFSYVCKQHITDQIVEKHQDINIYYQSHQYQENILWNLRCLTFIYFINIITAHSTRQVRINKTKGLMSNNFNYLQYVQPLIRENHYQTYQKQNRQQQFNSQADYDQMKQSISTTQPNQIKSRQNLYLLKLQSKVLQLKKKLDHQNFQIQTLTEEADNYVKLCQSQKSLINSLNIQMMRQEYQQQIMHLTYQNQKSKGLAFTIQQQCNSINKEQTDKLCKFRMQNQNITKKIEQALSRKQQFIYKIHEKEQQTKKYEETVHYQQQKIDQLRHIQRKFIIALKQIQKLKLY